MQGIQYGNANLREPYARHGSKGSKRNAENLPLIVRRRTRASRPRPHKITNPNPPSTASICPVMNFGAVAKNKTAAAISSPTAITPHRRLPRHLLHEAAAAFSPRSIIPGATQFTAISGASALAITFVSMCTAAFEEQ